MSICYEINSKNAALCCDFKETCLSTEEIRRYDDFISDVCNFYVRGILATPVGSKWTQPLGINGVIVVDAALPVVVIVFAVPMMVTTFVFGGLAGIICSHILMFSAFYAFSITKSYASATPILIVKRLLAERSELVIWIKRLFLCF